jgi:hypothetical protein
MIIYVMFIIAGLFEGTKGNQRGNKKDTKKIISQYTASVHENELTKCTEIC